MRPEEEAEAVQHRVVADRVVADRVVADRVVADPGTAAVHDQTRGFQEAVRNRRLQNTRR